MQQNPRNPSKFECKGNCEKLSGKKQREIQTKNVYVIVPHPVFFANSNGVINSFKSKYKLSGKSIPTIFRLL